MSEMPTMGELPPLEALDESAGLGEVVSRVNANTSAILAGLEVLRGIAVSYASALPASVADRKSLHTQADATDARLTATASTLSGVGTQAAAAATAAASAMSTANTAKATADAAAATASAAQALAASVSARLPRAVSGMVPAIASVISTNSADVTLTWPSAWPDTNYTVLAALEPPASLLGKVSVSVKSKTTTTVTLTITASAVIASGSVPVRAASFP